MMRCAWCSSHLVRPQVALSVGFQAALVGVSYTYLPATLYEIINSDGGAIDRVVSGDAIFIRGTNFFNAVTLRCRCAGCA